MFKIAILTAVLFTGCATSYQPNGITGGFSDRCFSKRQCEVTFRGNSYTGANKAHNYALKRAAEIALKAGYPAFKVLGGGVDVDTKLAKDVAGNPTLLNRPTGTVRFYLLTAEERDEVPDAYDAVMTFRSIN